MINPDCEEQAYFVNCDGNHPANSKTCHKWIVEKSRTKIKFTEKVSYFKAKKRIQNTQSNLNFAGVVQQQKSVLPRPVR